MDPILPSLGPAFWADARVLLLCIPDIDERRSAFYDMLFHCADQMDGTSRLAAAHVAQELGIAPGGALPLVVPVDHHFGDGLRSPADMAVWADATEQTPGAGEHLREVRIDYVSRFFALACGAVLLGFLGRLAIWGVWHR